MERKITVSVLIEPSPGADLMDTAREARSKGCDYMHYNGHLVRVSLEPLDHPLHGSCSIKTYINNRY